ncbi:glycosyltransferase family 69 protein [Fonsecaea pedrosoi]|nr:glycosyltransferase family 69 protein [Fonsecaea pedrosoi]
MALPFAMFLRGIDKTYLAILLLCIILISSFGGPFTSSQPKTGVVGDLVYRAARHNGSIHASSSGVELGDVVESHDTSPTHGLFNFYSEPWDPPGVSGLNDDRLKVIEPYMKAITDPGDGRFPRLRCPLPIKERYKILRRRRSLATRWDTPPRRWFFALDLQQCAPLLPRLLASVVETIRILRPQDCALSIVARPSNDGTLEILERIREEMGTLNVSYYFSTSDIDPYKEGSDYITEWAALRNLALDPLVRQPELYDPDTTVVFLNDVAICTDDILELIYQKASLWVYQNADMVCGMDWANQGETFNDVGASRGMTGDMFVNTPRDGSADPNNTMFRHDPRTKTRFEARLPFQVYSCWNGGAVFTAKPLLRENITFRASRPDECHMGEPLLLCKDFWKYGYGRIAVVPSVNVGYNDDESRQTKKRYGFATEIVQRVEQDVDVRALRNSKIRWQATPPKNVKCETDFSHPTEDELDESKKAAAAEGEANSAGSSDDTDKEQHHMIFEDGGGPDL